MKLVKHTYELKLFVLLFSKDMKKVFKTLFSKKPASCFNIAMLSVFWILIEGKYPSWLVSRVECWHTVLSGAGLRWEWSHTLWSACGSSGSVGTIVAMLPPIHQSHPTSLLSPVTSWRSTQQETLITWSLASDELTLSLWSEDVADSRQLGSNIQILW